MCVCVCVCVLSVMYKKHEACGLREQFDEPATKLCMSRDLFQLRETVI